MGKSRRAQKVMNPKRRWPEKFLATEMVVGVENKVLAFQEPIYCTCTHSKDCVSHSIDSCLNSPNLR